MIQKDPKLFYLPDPDQNYEQVIQVPILNWSVAYQHRFDADPDPTFCCDTNPDPDPAPDLDPDSDPDPYYFVKDQQFF